MNYSESLHTAKETDMTKQCPECGAPIAPRPAGKRGQVSTFCCTAHQTAFQQRQFQQGRAIIALAKAWRASRNRKEDREIGAAALTEMYAIIDSFNSEDIKAGRPRCTEYAARLLANGRFIDRRRTK